MLKTGGPMARRFSLTGRASARSSGAGARSRSILGSTAAGEDTLKDLRKELAYWEGAATADYLTGELSSVDLTVFPFIALFMRLAGRRKDFVKDDVIGPRIAAWIDRMQTLPIVQRTWPPLWKRGAPS
jgi:glutathione S-transferase